MSWLYDLPVVPMWQVLVFAVVSHLVLFGLFLWALRASNQRRGQ